MAEQFGENRLRKGGTRAETDLVGLVSLDSLAGGWLKKIRAATFPFRPVTALVESPRRLQLDV